MFFRLLLAGLALVAVSAVAVAADPDGVGDGAAPIHAIPENLMCESYILGAKCGGLLTRLCPGDSFCRSGRCACPPGTCANPAGFSKCEAYGYVPNTPPRKDAKKIACPVLAALYNDGTLRPDALGRVTLSHLKDALHNGAGTDSADAHFQALGVAAYSDDDLDEESRKRCMPLTSCWWKRIQNGEDDLPEDAERYLNIFKMDQNPKVQHGYSTATRKDTHGRPVGQVAECDSVPCEARFEEFWAAHADENGRLYKENIAQVICYAKDHGDRGGEFSLAGQTFLRQWQMKAASLGWLDMISLLDEKGEKYIRVADARTMLMEGRMPDGWQRRAWGSIGDLVRKVTWKLPCEDDVPPEVTENLPDVGDEEAVRSATA